MFKSLVYNPADGIFLGTDWELRYDEESGTYSVTNSKGDTITLTASNRDALLNSTFGTSIGISGLTNEVSNVVGAATGVFSAVGTNITTMKNWNGFAELVGKIGLEDDATPEELANATVLYAAQEISRQVANGKISTDLASNAIFKNNGMSNEWAMMIAQNYGGTSGQGGLTILSAMNYAMATAYANSDYGKTATLTVDGKTMTAYDYYKSVSSSLSDSQNGSNALNTVTQMNNKLAKSSNWNDYVTNKANDDFAAFLGTMQTINSNVSNIDSETYLNEGVSGEYMTEILSLLYN